MPAHNHGHVPIYHPVLDVVSHVDARSVKAWERAGWQPGTKPTPRRGAPAADRPVDDGAPTAPSPDEPASPDAPQTPAAPATGLDDVDSTPSPAPVKEN